MNRSENQTWEKYIFDSLNLCLETPFSLKGFGNADRKEPDILVWDESEKMGIEIVTTYINQDHSQYDWLTRRRSVDTEVECKSPPLIINGPEQALHFAEEMVLKKLKKLSSGNYEGVDRCSLCIYEENPFSDEDYVTSQLIPRIKSAISTSTTRFNRYFLIHLPPYSVNGHRCYEIKI